MGNADIKNDRLDAEVLRLKRALDNVPAYVYMKDLNSRYLYANKLTMALFGCGDESELIGHDDDQFFPPETAAELREIDQRVFQGQHSDREIATTDADDNPRIYWEVKTPLYEDESGDKIIGLLGISTDITQIKLLTEENQALREDLASDLNQEIIGADFGLAPTLALATKAAQHASSVLLLGETGVGKDVIANYIHKVSNRNAGPFISVNCGAIPESLMDSELFGHEKGAFTGAVDSKRGKFERASGGTIFLDEIGELPLQIQVRLLRVLQNHEIERVGGTDTIPIDIRVIAATHKDIERMVSEGGFREDLFFRLNVFPIKVPPLRERGQDLPALLEYFVKRKSQLLKLGTPPRISQDLLRRLRDYDWPGNVRELENVVERALIINESPELAVPPLRNRGGEPTPALPSLPPPDSDEIVSLEQAMTQHIKRALARCAGRIHGKDGAADLLEINPNTLRSRMRRLGIPFS